MCGPAAIPIAMGVGMAASAAGGIMGAKGAKEAAAAQNAYYNDLANNDEKMAKLTLESGDRNRGLLNEQASKEITSLHNEAARFAAAQKTGMVANGVSLSSVTAQDIAKDTFNKEAMDEAAIRYNADLKAYEINNQSEIGAWQLRERARQQRMAGANAIAAGDINATTSLLGGASSMASNFMSFSGTSTGKKWFGG